MSTERDEAFEKAWFAYTRARPTVPNCEKQSFFAGFEAGRAAEAESACEMIAGYRMALPVRFQSDLDAWKRGLIQTIQEAAARHTAPSAPPKGQPRDTYDPLPPDVLADARQDRLPETKGQGKTTGGGSAGGVDILTGSPPETPPTEARVREIVQERDFKLGPWIRNLARQEINAPELDILGRIQALEAARGEKPEASRIGDMTASEIAAFKAQADSADKLENLVEAARAWREGRVSNVAHISDRWDRDLAAAVDALPSKPPSAPSRPEPGAREDGVSWAVAGGPVGSGGTTSRSHERATAPPPAVEELTAEERWSRAIVSRRLPAHSWECGFNRDYFIHQIHEAEAAARAAALEECCTVNPPCTGWTGGITKGESLHYESWALGVENQRAAIRSLLHSPAAGAKKGPA